MRMKIRKWRIKRRCKNPKFLVVVTCQGNPSYYQHHFLIGAVFNYCKQYCTKKKYGIMNFVLRPVFITDEFEEETECP